MNKIKGASWHKIGELTKTRLGCGISIIDDKLYVVGGADHGRGIREVECFDIRTNTLDSKATSRLNCKRNCVGVATHAGKIYAVGGHDDDSGKSLDTVEVWNGTSWKMLDAKMNQRRRELAVVVHNNHLFAIGGVAGLKSLNTCEWLDLTQDENKQR